MNPTIDEYETLDEAVAAWVKAAEGTQEVRVWLSPGTPTLVKLPRKQMPSILVGRLLTTNRNDYFFRPMNWPFLMRAHHLPQRLGICVSDRTVRRLAMAGFVKAVFLAPGCMLIDLQSLYDHMQASSGEDGAWWWTPERVARYREAVSIDRRGTRPPAKHDKDKTKIPPAIAEAVARN